MNLEAKLTQSNCLLFLHIYFWLHLTAIRFLSAWQILKFDFFNANAFQIKHVVCLIDLFTVTKLIALFIIILSGSVWIIQGKTDNLNGLMENSSDSPGNYALAFYSVIISLSYVSICYVMYPKNHIILSQIWIILPILPSLIIVWHVRGLFYTILSEEALTYVEPIVARVALHFNTNECE